MSGLAVGRSIHFRPPGNSVSIHFRRYVPYRLTEFSRGMSDSKMQLMLIGCGQIGRVHARRLAEDGRAQLGVLCDPLVENARRIQQEFFPDALVTDSIEQGLSHPGLSGVIIATPTHLHAEQAHAALKRNLPILCEKPLAETREKITELVRLAEAPGMPEVVVGYQRRFSSQYRTLKREIDSGKWGKILAINLHNSEDWKQSQAYPGTWRNDPAQNPGGYIGDAGSHKIDMVLNLSKSRPVDLFANIDDAHTPVPIRGSVTAKLDGGIMLSMSLFGDAQHFREDLHIVMERADFVLREQEVWIARNKQLEKIEDPEPDSDATLGFVDILEGKLPNLAPARCALDVFDFTAAILESAHKGERISFV